MYTAHCAAANLESDLREEVPKQMPYKAKKITILLLYRNKAIFFI